MSGVLHPEGPEPVRTYWLRRVLVILALMILVLISLGLARASSGATRPAAPPPVAPSPTVSLSPSPTLTSGPVSSPTSASPSPSVSSARSTSTASPSSSSDASAQRSARDAATTATPACERKQLQATLVGRQMLKLARPASFKVTLRNEGDETCLLSLAKADFELKVSSGKKVVWSSKSCSTAVFAVAAKLELDQTLSWLIAWDGRSTGAGCVTAGTPPKPGTYLATAQVSGGKTAKLPITLRD